MDRVKRLTAICCVALGCGLAPPTAAAWQPPRARLRSLVCQRALDPASRAISITAVMRPLPGTAKMAMRFELLRRARRGARATSLSGRDLKTWITPTNPPTLGQLPGDVWVVQHPVVDLIAPDLYRFRVEFRWSAADGKVLGTIVRVSRACAQPELRPDIAVLAIRVFPLAAGIDRYGAVVRNDGATAAGPFTVALSIGGSVVATKPVAGLEPHAQIVVPFRAPACTAGEPIEASADPGPAYQIDDPDRANNTLAASCPGG
jgi:hypothetical protein